MSEQRVRKLESLTEDHEDRLSELEREERRTRKRLHELESDRHTLALTVRTVKELAGKVGVSHDNMEAIAEDAAGRAIDKDRARRRENVWRTAVRVASILAAVGTLGYFIAYLFSA